MSQKGEILSEQSESKGFAPILIVLLIAILGIGGVFVFEKYFDKSYLPPQDAAQPVVQPSTSPDSTNNTEVIATVKNYSANNGYNNPIITSDFIKSTEARGNISEIGVAGGNKWFAAKINGAWTVVWVGNGLPQCSEVAKYNLPKDFLTCY